MPTATHATKTARTKEATAPAMSSRERWLAALDGQPVDRLPFWPKLDGAYARAQRAPFRNMSTDELHEFIGSDRPGWIPSGFRQTRRCTTYSCEERDGERLEVFGTPAGELRRRSRFEPISHSWHPVEMPVSSREDVLVMTEWYADASAEPDPEKVERARASQAEAEASGRDATTANLGITPLMDWVEHLAGVENGHLLLYDHPEEVGALFAAMRRLLLRQVEIAAERCPADLFYLIENTSTSLISPEQFREHCLPLMQECAGMVRARGKRLGLHMCGLLKAILPDLARSGAHAFEAFTSPTVGNTRLADGRAACPDVCLIGGTNAALWTRPATTIIAELERDLAALPHHRRLVVTSGGVMPPLCPPETIREVAEWVRRYES